MVGGKYKKLMVFCVVGNPHFTYGSEWGKNPVNQPDYGISEEPESIDEIDSERIALESE